MSEQINENVTLNNNCKSSEDNAVFVPTDSNENYTYGLIANHEFDNSGDDGDASDLSQITVDEEPIRVKSVTKYKRNSSEKVNEIVQYKKLIEIIRANPKNSNHQFNEMMIECQKYFCFELLPEQENILKRQVRTFKDHYNQKLRSCHRDKN